MSQPAHDNVTPLDVAKPGPASPVLVTPEMASRWLKANTRNRNLRARSVDAYARDMKAGRWHLTGDGVKFAPDGTLLDGQHRLSAVVKSGVAVMMYVFRNIAPEAQAAMDQNITRKAGDALNLLGYKHYSGLAAAARVAIHYEAGQLPSQTNYKVTNDEVQAFVETNHDLLSAVDRGVSLRHHIDVPPAVLSCAIWLLRRVDLEDAEQFLWKWSNLTGLEAGDPILALNARLRAIKRSRQNVKRAEYLALVIRAWNHWRDGNTVASLPLRAHSGPTQIPVPR